MKEIENRAKSRLEAGELSLGIGLRMARTVDIGKAMKTAGMDWLFIDMEHNSMSVDTGVQIAVAALDAGISPIARVPPGDFRLANRMLDGGALGIVMPHVDTVDDARRMVAELRSPPRGHRGVSSSIPQFDYDITDLGAAIAALDRETLLVAMLEEQGAIDQAAEITAIDGIDVVMIGTNDFAASIGVPGDVGDQRVVEAYRNVSAACRSHGKWLGMGGVGDSDLVKRYVEMGVRFILAGNDINYLISGVRQRTAELRSISLPAVAQQSCGFDA